MVVKATSNNIPHWKTNATPEDPSMSPSMTTLAFHAFFPVQLAHRDGFFCSELLLELLLLLVLLLELEVDAEFDPVVPVTSAVFDENRVICNRNLGNLR